MDETVRLTARETDVLQLLARGCTYSQAGIALGVSRHTIATHVKSAYLKLDVHSAAGAVMRAIELRLIGVAGSRGRKR
jgi:DNA-binding CsgD family transcriptional regulator